MESGYTFNKVYPFHTFRYGSWSDTCVGIYVNEVNFFYIVLRKIRPIMNVTDDKQEKQVVSKQRVADHGEVYTAKREVNAMLDLVKNSCGSVFDFHK